LVSKIASFYGRKFDALASSLIFSIAMKVFSIKVSNLEQMKFVNLQQMKNVFASSFSYNYNDFYNIIHCNRDDSSYI